MSDHWETFPCTVGDKIAWITYDHGIREHIVAVPFPYCVRVRVDLRSPDERGLPQGDEFKALNNIEDALVARRAGRAGLQVGRITTNGARHFVLYTNFDEARCEAEALAALEPFGYQVTLAHEPDPKRQIYWNHLFPSAEDWQVIQDMKVEQSLRDNGDPLTEPRPVDHYAYFPSEEDRRRFIEALRARFNDIESVASKSERSGEFGVRIQHVNVPHYAAMNEFTVLLTREAKRCNGEYDGWETKILKA